MFHTLALALAFALPAGPCACTPGQLCTWAKTKYSSSHTENPPRGTRARSILNKTNKSVRVRGVVGQTRRSFCLNPGEGQSNTGAFTVRRVIVRSSPCP